MHRPDVITKKRSFCVQCCHALLCIPQLKPGWGPQLTTSSAENRSNHAAYSKNSRKKRLSPGEAALASSLAEICGRWVFFFFWIRLHDFHNFHLTYIRVAYFIKSTVLCTQGNFNPWEGWLRNYTFQKYAHIIHLIHPSGLYLKYPNFVIQI